MSSTAQTAPEAKELSRVFDLQREHQWDVKASTASERKAKLARLKAAVEAHADDIIAAVREDTRKPEGEIRVTEVLNVTANIQRNIDNLDAWMKPTEIAPSMNPNDKAQIVYEARGVCLILGPWNFPLGLAFGPLAAAVAAGNCCMVKLTDLCPATARIAGVIVREVFDENEVALFEGDVGVAQALLELPFNHMFFTGSTRVGKIVMAAAAKHLASVTLELGGKSPVIIDEGADIEKIAADLAGAKQFNGGQACICPDYVFVKESEKDRLVAGFKAKVAENLYAGALAAGLNKKPYISLKEMAELAKQWTGALNVKAINDNARVVELSGGNQQKVVIGKGLIQKPRIVIFDEPTRGVDVGAIAEIHQLINKLADAGLAVIVISSYLPEIMKLSDRILVCRQGRMVEEFSPFDATEEKIMYAAVH